MNGDHLLHAVYHLNCLLSSFATQVFAGLQFTKWSGLYHTNCLLRCPPLSSPAEHTTRSCRILDLALFKLSEFQELLLNMTHCKKLELSPAVSGAQHFIPHPSAGLHSEASNRQVSSLRGRSLEWGGGGLHTPPPRGWGKTSPSCTACILPSGTKSAWKENTDRNHLPSPEAWKRLHVDPLILPPSPRPGMNFIWRENEGGCEGEGAERGRPGTSGQLCSVNSEDCRESLSPLDKGNGPWSEIDDLQNAGRQRGYCASRSLGLRKKERANNLNGAAVCGTRSPTTSTRQQRKQSRVAMFIFLSISSASQQEYLKTYLRLLLLVLVLVLPSRMLGAREIVMDLDSPSSIMGETVT